MGSNMIGGMTHYAPPIMMGAGMLAGGAVGRTLDPFTAGISAFGKSVGWDAGGGMMGFSPSGNLGANIGRFTSQGLRGGLTMGARGLAAGAVAAAPIMAGYEAMKWAGGQMMEGAHFQNQVGGFLQNQMRFANPMSSSGHGFTSGDRQQIGGMVREMGDADMWTNSKELFGLMKQGVSTGLFDGAEEAKEFSSRFKKMVTTLKGIAKEMNTSLTEAMPLFKEARAQGFWTPQDITKYAQDVHSSAYATGMSTSQASQMMGVGAQMGRSIGASGAQGAQMMGQSMNMAGTGKWAGLISSEELGEAGFGTGREGVSNFAQFMAGGTARFARSKVGRWALASMMGKDGNLDAAKLQRFTSGGMDLGEIESSARRNVAGRGNALKFVNNEHDLRGQLAAQGPAAMTGMLQTIIRRSGGDLHGTSDRDKRITERITRRFFGGDRKQARMIAKYAREMPAIQRMHTARTEEMMDAQARTRDETMSHSMEAWKRKMGKWYDQNVTSVWRKMGADFSSELGRSTQKLADWYWDRPGENQGLSGGAVSDLAASAMLGQNSLAERAFGTGPVTREMGGTTTFSGDSRSLMEASGFRGTNERATGLTQAKRYIGGSIVGLPIAGMIHGLQKWTGTDTGKADYSAADIKKMNTVSRATRGMLGTEEAGALGWTTDQVASYRKGGASKELDKFLVSKEALRARQDMRYETGDAELNQTQQQELFGRYAGLIQQGEGYDTLKKALAGSEGVAASARVMALQSGKARGFVTGSEGLTGVRAGLGDAAGRESDWEEQKGALGNAVKDDVAGFDVSGNGSIGGRLVQGLSSPLRAMQGNKAREQAQSAMEFLKGNPEGQLALTIMASGKPEDIKRGQAMITKMGATNKDVSEDVRQGLSVIGRLTEANKAGMAALVGAGQNAQSTQDAAFKRIAGSRMTRFRTALGDRLGAVEGLKGELGDAMNAAMSATDPTKRRDALIKLAGAAMGDADGAGKLLAGIAGTEGGGDLEHTLRGALEAEGTMRKGTVSSEQEAGLTAGRGGGLGAARRGVRELGRMQRMTGDAALKNDEVNKLIRGKADDALRAKLRAHYEAITRSPKEAQDATDKFIAQAKGGFTKEEMGDNVKRAAAAGGISVMSGKAAKQFGYNEDATARLNELGQRNPNQLMAAQLTALESIDKNISALAKDKGGGGGVVKPAKQAG